MTGSNGAWLERLAAGGVLLVDGAMGTELRRRGTALDPVAWSGPASLSHAKLLEAIHADYLLAGAEVITTNTFGTNRFVLAAAGYGDRFEAVNRAAFEAARRARDTVRPDAAIAGSISCLPPNFDTRRYPDPAAESAAYLELATLLAELGADLLVLEMMEDVEHAARACEAVRQVGVPFWIGISARFEDSSIRIDDSDARFEDSSTHVDDSDARLDDSDADFGPTRADSADARRPFRRLVAYDFPATPLAEILDALLPFSPAAINVMHTPIDAVSAALDEVAAKWQGYRGAYPELGSAAPRSSQDVTGDRLVELALQWTAAGAQILGGCCGTTPEHIAALREQCRRTTPATARSTPTTARSRGR